MSKILPFDPSRWPHWPPYGFRISLVDILAITITALVTWQAWSHIATLVVLLPIALGHFFLFCNVFRVRRNLEIIWALFFIMLACVWLFTQPVAWWWLVIWQLPVTLVVLIIEVRSPRYHGVGARRLNANLSEYLAKRVKE